jgi:hypothetical protein
MNFFVVLIPGIRGDQIADASCGDGVDGLLHDVDHTVAGLNVSLLNLGPVDGDCCLQYTKTTFVSVCNKCVKK